MCVGGGGRGVCLVWVLVLNWVLVGEDGGPKLDELWDLLLRAQL